MNNILIILDLEIIIGVEDLRDKKTNEILLYKEISTIINCMPDNNIYLCYSHNDGVLPGNLVEDLNSRLHIIEKIKNIDFNIKYDTAFLIGFHGKKSDCCKFPHTFRDEIEALFLGDKEVGEIEMIVNLLAYYKIPVSLISTETSVINYLNYNCIYHNIDRGNISLIYLNLENDVKRALNSQNILSEFNNSKVTIAYNKYVQKMIEELELDVETSFGNTIDFFNYLPGLHIPLNYIIKKNIDIRYKIIKNRPKSLDLIRDKNIRKLLDKDIESLTYFDLSKIAEYFSKFKKEVMK